MAPGYFHSSSRLCRIIAKPPKPMASSENTAGSGMLEVITIGEVVETFSIVIPVTRWILENWFKENVLPQDSGGSFVEGFHSLQ